MAVIRDQPGVGIVFGADGLAIALSPGTEKLARCKLGPYYAKMCDGGKSLFAVGESPRATELTSLRVYVSEGTGKRILPLLAPCSISLKAAHAGSAHKWSSQVVLLTSTDGRQISYHMLG